MGMRIQEKEQQDNVAMVQWTAKYKIILAVCVVVWFMVLIQWVG
ncbi:hypothetical protein [Paenibacillus spiritus]|nr:hypothetical protein [Paenibacillus spiritus]